jgi:hypothetical protein
MGKENHTFFAPTSPPPIILAKPQPATQVIQESEVAIMTMLADGVGAISNDSKESTAFLTYFFPLMSPRVAQMLKNYKNIKIF